MRTKDTGTLQYELCFNSENTECLVLERYRDSQALIEHGKDADEAFAAWCEGRTGYPLVDAAMAQINQTGWMHNRLRMLTASFLTKDLGIDWRRGEAYFALHLIDYELASNNGGWQWAASTGCDAQPWFRADESLPYAVVASFSDITHLRRAEEALRQAHGELERKVAERTAELRRSEAYLAEAQRLSQTSSWAWDARRREFVYFSPEVYRLFGFDPKKNIGSPQPFYDRILPEDRERVIEMAQQAVQEKAGREVDFRIALPDGSIKYVHSVGYPLLGTDGEVVEVVSTHIDVTGQHLANETLQKAFDEIKKSEDRLRLVVDTIPALVWRASPDGIPDFLNQPALNYTGLRMDQVETGWPRAFHPEDKKGMLQKWTAIRESGMPGELEARLRRFDGEYRRFLFRGVPLRDSSRSYACWQIGTAAA